MADELRAAAERIRNHSIGPHLFKHGGDMATLAFGYLAEHPADDSIAIDERWLRSVGFKTWDLAETDPEYDLFILMRDELGWQCRLAYQSNGFYAVRICEDQEFGVAESVELLGTRNMRPTVTKGAVRLLCRALGITLQENAK